MKPWLVVAGLLLFLFLPALLTAIPMPSTGVPVQQTQGTDDEEVPPPRMLLTADQREALFLNMWTLIDEEYLHFDRRNVDWDAVREKYLPLVRNATNDWELRTPLKQALAELGDGHVYLVADDDTEGRPHLWVEPDGDQIVIAWVDAGTDAEAAGLRPGMVLLEVDGVPAAEAWDRDVTGFSASTEAGRAWGAARDILRGRFGTKVNVTAGFPGQAPVTAELVRRRGLKPYPSDFGTKELPGGIIYFYLRAFPQDTAAQETIHALAEEVVRANPRGLIVDTRYNRGGSGVFAAWLSGHFFRQPRVFGISVDHSADTKQVWGTGSYSMAYDGPMVLLTNPGCGSACDAFASVMKNQGRAVLVGENPAGAAISTEAWPLLHGFKIRLSTPWELLDSNGKPIEGNPAEVDHRVVPTAADWAAGRDPALEKALELLGTTDRP